MERLAAKLGMTLNNGQHAGGKALVLRCPDLGKDREEALRKQIGALEETLGGERTAHAESLRSLQRRVSDSERELAQTEFKIMDAADAERALRAEWGPELTRLRDEAKKLGEARDAASAARNLADKRAQEVAFLRRQCADVNEQLLASEEAAHRRSASADDIAASLRRALARRRELLQKMLHADPSGPLISMLDGAELQAVVEEIRAALREEAQQSQCCVCADAPVNAVVLPCRHQQLCVICAAALSTCPVCRAPIESRMQVYA